MLLINRASSTIRDAIAATGKSTGEAIAENAKAIEAQQPLQPPTRITVDVQIPPEETTRYYAEQRNSNRVQWATFWATVGTFIAVAVYAAITYCQWRTMEGTYRQIIKQTGYVRESATAARDAVNQAHDQFQQDTRAWVGISGFNANPAEFKPLAKIIVNAEIRNYGKTVAFIDEISSKVEVRTTRVPEDFDYGIPNRKFVIFPGQPPLMSADVSTIITEKDFPDVKRVGAKKLKFHGLIRYHDGLGQHSTTFCLFWTGDDKFFGTCEEHNNAN